MVTRASVARFSAVGAAGAEEAGRAVPRPGADSADLAEAAGASAGAALDQAGRDDAHKGFS